MFANFITAVTTLDPQVRQTNLPDVTAGSSALHEIVQIVIGIVAALSVLFIVIGGLRYVLSDGDPQGASKARSTVVYALVGLVIAISAEAIVGFAIKGL